MSFSEPDLKYGSGTGLGLKIVRDIVRTYDGDIQFIRPPELANMYRNNLS